MYFARPQNSGNRRLLWRQGLGVLQRLTLFGGIGRPIIDSGDTCLMATYMVDDSLDDMRLDAEFGHSSDRRSTQIMEHPGGHLLNIFQ